MNIGLGYILINMEYYLNRKESYYLERKKDLR
jgi:hypothetical protein